MISSFFSNSSYGLYEEPIVVPDQCLDFLDLGFGKGERAAWRSVATGLSM